MKGNLFLLLPIFVPVAMALVQYYVRLTAKGRNVLTVLTLAATAAMAVYAAMHQGMECVLWNMTDRISIAFRVDGLSVLYLSLISIVWPVCYGISRARRQPAPVLSVLSDYAGRADGAFHGEKPHHAVYVL